ncbi:MAG: Zn-ribbon domain-containing protein [Candidatus Methanoperedens sp.]|nr:Zn-ribbon domain-containing protein [Candidatus Methanoperedens sp.]
MPHKCTRCENVFKDGAAIILNGCPKCGWNKFLYVRDITPGPLAGKTGQTGAIPPAASKFIKEVDELLSNKMPPESKEAVKKKPEEIGERVESVRILSPGSYELNLESLLERDEIVMALKEDGTYLVHLPSVFQKKKHHER